MERIKAKNNNYNVVSLFSGIGGFDIGFLNAGFNIIWANDIDKYAAETYKANVSKNILLGDIRLVKSKIPKHDVLIGGFPCQPFSSLGKLKGFEDKERGTLFFEIKDIIQKYNTKIVVLENVKNIKSHNKGETFSRIIKELEDIGYTCYSEILNSMDYGVPQRRNRCYIVAIKRDLFLEKDFIFPEKQELKISMKDILDKDVDSKYFLSKKICNTILGYGTKNYKAKPTIDTPIAKTLTATMNKMHRASQDNYVTDEFNRAKFDNDNKTALRKLTPNECRKLQGFPSDWKQVVSDCQAYKQFGNAVTVNVSYNVALKVKEYLDNNLLK